MTSDFEATHGPLLDVPVSEIQISRLEEAVEGECDGLAISRDQAVSILRYVLAPSSENPRAISQMRGSETCPRLGLPHQYWPQGNCQYCGAMSPTEAEIERVVQSVNEWDDRTSPDDYPEHLLITSEELADLLRDFAATATAMSGVGAEREFLAKEARRYASHYPEASDGRSTFILFAEMIERRAAIATEGK